MLGATSTAGLLQPISEPAVNLEEKWAAFNSPVDPEIRKPDIFAFFKVKHR